MAVITPMLATLYTQPTTARRDRRQEQSGAITMDQTDFISQECTGTNEIEEPTFTTQQERTWPTYLGKVELSVEGSHFSATTESRRTEVRHPPPTLDNKSNKPIQPIILAKTIKTFQANAGYTEQQLR